MPKKFDIVVALVLVQAFVLFAKLATDIPQLRQFGSTLNGHLGAEYNEIAKSIYAGEGYSSPFRVQSGPTAWMPPVLSYLQAGLYYVTGGDRDTVVLIVLTMRNAVIIFTAWIVLSEARRLNRWWTGLFLLIVGLILNYRELFQITHDIWVILLMLNLIWCGGIQLENVSARARFATWGILGGFAALCGPVAGATWAGLTVVLCAVEFRRRRLCRMPSAIAIQCLFIAAAASIVVVLPWSIRNRVVLGKWIPVKSNVMYEVWLSNCLDDDGVLDSKAQQRHPWTNKGHQRNRYLEVGEIAFLEELKADAIATIKSNPTEALRRLGRRFLVATLTYRPISDRHETQRAGQIRFRRSLFWIPFVCWLILLVKLFTNRDHRVLVAFCMYAFYLTPYIVISYYDRYAAPLVTIKVLVVLFGIHTLMGAARKLRHRPMQAEE